MGVETIGLGETAGDGTGDDARTAGGKLNRMFAELYALPGKHINRTFVEDVGVVEGMTADPLCNTAAINAALAAGMRLQMRPGSLVKIASSLLPGAGSGLFGMGSSTRPTLWMPKRNFTNASLLYPARYAANAVAINATGRDNVTIENVAIAAEPGDGRVLRGFVSQRSDALTLNGVEVYGLPLGTGICLAGITGNSIVDGCHIHDFYSDGSYDGHPQSTGIEIDNDVLGGIYSDELLINSPHIHDLRVGAGIAAVYGNETDGINVVNSNTRGVQIRQARIHHVGEGVDFFGSFGRIDGTFDFCENFGVKLIHGAKYNRIDATIRNSGLGGLLISGSNDPTLGSAAYNEANVSIINVGVYGKYSDADSTGCVRFINNGSNASTYPEHNTIRGTLVPGGNGKFGWFDGSTGSENMGLDLQIAAAASARVLVQHGGGAVRPIGASAFVTNLA